MELGGRPRYLAIDIGAESGRVIVGEVSDRSIELEEVHRFQHRPLDLPDRLAWNMTGILDEITAGIEVAGPTRSVSVDGWAVDFGLVRSDLSLVALPRSHRDPLTAGILPLLFERIPEDDLYSLTGIQKLEINTLPQLFALRLRAAAELDNASKLLLLPDLLHVWLGAEPVAERTNASTTQLISLDAKPLEQLAAACDLPPHLPYSVVEPGTTIGRLRSRGPRKIASGTSLVTGETHNTESTVVVTPLSEHSSADLFISCGTWSLVGLELPHAHVSPTTQTLNLSNEAGYGGTTRLLRNVMGLWLLQRSKAAFLRDAHSLTYPEMVKLAAKAAPFGSLIDPDDSSFLRVTDAPEAVRIYCRRSGQREPATVGEVVRTVLESLALRFRWFVEALQTATGRQVSTINMVGGGSENQLLCQMTADATGLQVLAGPTETP